MRNPALTLRPETPADWQEVEAMTREAFWNHYVPGCDEHCLAHALRGQPAFLPALDYVAVTGGRVVGNIMYCRATVALDAGGELDVLTFGPLTVLPAWQNRGVGRRLIERTCTLAAAQCYAAVLIYGDPDYYSRRGFLPAERYGIGTSGNLYHAALQARELRPGALAQAAGRFLEGPAYHVDAAECEAFDRLFPRKEKVLGTRSQLRHQAILAMGRPRGDAEAKPEGGAQG